MATRYAANILPDNSTDAHFQAWAQFIEDTFITTGGWVVTSDTGQTAPASLVHPTTNAIKKGYRIYRMADALQATAPIFMRIDFGSSTSSANAPGIWLHIGTGSDGAGNITGVLWDGGGSSSPTVMSGATSAAIGTNSYGSADTGRACFCLFVNVSNWAYYLLLGIERTRNSSGASTGDGLYLIYGSGTVGTSDSGLTRSRYLRYSGGTQPTEEQGLSYITTNNNPSETFTPGDVGVGVVIHFLGAAQQPGTQWMICNSSDVSSEGTVTMSLYGSVRTYQQLGLVFPEKAYVGAAPNNDSNARVLMRFD